jgi:ribosomal protein S18 acetylase RimI-like enzyme
MALLAWYPVASGRHYWIEDVVVARQARGRGIGEALVRRAMDLAREAGAEFVDLTSRPAREAANRLYMRMGFEPRETTVYRYHLATAVVDGASDFRPV